jgi:hypothetical protein
MQAMNAQILFENLKNFKKLYLLFELLYLFFFQNLCDLFADAPSVPIYLILPLPYQ